MDFTAGWIAERGSLLGSFGQGAFGNLSAGTAFFGFDGGLELGRWSIAATGEFGVVSPVTQGNDPGDLGARDQHLRGSCESGVPEPGRGAFLAVAATLGGKRLGVAHGAGGPDEAGRSYGRKWVTT